MADLADGPAASREDDPGLFLRSRWTRLERAPARFERRTERHRRTPCVVAAGWREPATRPGRGSVGGLYARQFVADYSSEVAGLVFVDSSSPEQIYAIPSSAYSAELIRQKHREVMFEWWKEASGWSLLAGDCKADVERGLEQYKNLARTEACRPSYATSWRREADEFWDSAEEAAQAWCCRDIPLVIISQDPDNPQSAQPVLVRPIWNSLQEHLKILSSHSSRIIARGSGHHVMIDRPDVVVRTIQRVATQTMSHTANPSFGTTSIE